MGIQFTNDDIRFFIELLHRCGEQALSMQNGQLAITRKEDTTIVTQADLFVQNTLIEAIANRYESVQFIHEEQSAHSSISTWTGPVPNDRMTVVIDPIDGTAMYSMHLPIWCISVGIFYGMQPTYGFVYAPGFKMMFHNDDHNAYLNGEVRKVNSHMVIDSESNLFFASEFKNVGNVRFPGKIRNLGSTALHACLTIDNVRNRTLGFIGKSHLWDWAGSIPIVQKAGGHIHYLSGAPLDYNDIFQNDFVMPDFLVVYNSTEFEEIKKYIQ